MYIYTYTIVNRYIKVTDRCYIRDIHPIAGGYETTGNTYNDIHNILLSMHSKVVN